MSTSTAFWSKFGILRIFWRNFVRAFWYGFAARPYITILGYILVPIVGVTPIIQVYANGYLVDALVAQATVEAIALAAGFVVVTRMFEIFNTLSYWCNNIFRRTLEEKTEIDLLKKRAALDIEIYERPTTQDMLKRVESRGKNSVSELVISSRTLMSDVVEVCVALAVFATSYWWLAPLVLAGTLPRMYIEVRYGNRVWSIFSIHSEESRRYTVASGAFKGKANIIELKLLQAVEWMLARAESLFATYHNRHASNHDEYHRYSIISRVFNEVILGIALVLLVREVYVGALSIGIFVFLVASMRQLQGTLQSMYSLFGSITRDSSFVADYFNFLEMPNVLPQDPHARPVDDGSVHIVFDSVSFTYPDSKRPTLTNISFTLSPGQRVALVGLNGAGKTTLVKLLCRFYDPTEGRILVNGVDLRTVDLASWYAKLAVLFQDFQVYRFTVAESIAIGRTDRPMDMQKVADAAARSEAAEFIEKFDKKYDAQLGKIFTDGEELSGGQWQKLAIARTLYRDASVIVLDEPTAAVDADAEAKIFDRLEQDHSHASMLLISHRFSTVRHADEILILDQGTITERGTHEQLMSLNGTYARLFSLQAKGYT